MANYDQLIWGELPEVFTEAQVSVTLILEYPKRGG